MRRLTLSIPIRIVAALALLGAGLSACASAVSSSEAAGERIGAYGVTASLPAGWHWVPLKNLPGAKVPLELASFRTRGAVRGICTPGSIVDQIPPGGALVQLLDDGGFSDARDHQAGAVSRPEMLGDYEPLARPFRLGAPEGHECGEGYNIFFRRSGRVFQLRIWTTPAGPSQTVRGQIEALMDGLRVRPSAAQRFETER